jgi:hypothetical protein
MADESAPLPPESNQESSKRGPVSQSLVPAVSASGEAALIREEYLPEALRLLIEAGPRGLAAGLQVATRWSDQQAEEMRALRQELREVRATEAALREQLHMAEKNVTRLDERLTATRAQAGLRALGITVGTLVFGVAVVTDNVPIKVILAVLSLALVIALSLAPLAQRGSVE